MGEGNKIATQHKTQQIIQNSDISAKAIKSSTVDTFIFSHQNFFCEFRNVFSASKLLKTKHCGVRTQIPLQVTGIYGQYRSRSMIFVLIIFSSQIFCGDPQKVWTRWRAFANFYSLANWFSVDRQTRKAFRRQLLFQSRVTRWFLFKTKTATKEPKSNQEWRTPLLQLI